MKSKLLIAIATLVVLCGCRGTVPIYNVTDAPVNVAKPPATLQSVEQAIVRAGIGLGWAMKPERPGLITGTLNLRTHTAVVSIPYSTSTYSILYRESVNLNQKDDKIHPNYNSWIQNLNKAINQQFLM